MAFLFHGIDRNFQRSMTVIVAGRTNNSCWCCQQDGSADEADSIARTRPSSFAYKYTILRTVTRFVQSLYSDFYVHTHTQVININRTSVRWRPSVFIIKFLCVCLFFFRSCNNTAVVYSCKIGRARVYVWSRLNW